MEKEGGRRLDFSWVKSLLSNLKKTLRVETEEGHSYVWANAYARCGGKIILYGPAPTKFLFDEHGIPVKVHATLDITCPYCGVAIVALKPFLNEEQAQEYIEARLAFIEARRLAKKG